MKIQYLWMYVIFQSIIKSYGYEKTKTKIKGVRGNFYTSEIVILD